MDWKFFKKAIDFSGQMEYDSGWLEDANHRKRMDRSVGT